MDHFNLKIIRHEGKMVWLEKDYVIEVEGPNLFKLLQGGQVIAPFAGMESLCQFIITDMNLSETD